MMMCLVTGYHVAPPPRGKSVQSIRRRDFRSGLRLVLGGALNGAVRRVPDWRIAELIVAVGVKG